MPTYLYEIIETGETFEISQGIRDDAYEEYPHPETQELVKVKRLITGGGGFVLKGTGWSKKSHNPAHDIEIPKAAMVDGKGYLNSGEGGRIKRSAPKKADETSAEKLEKDRKFTEWVNSGGLDDVSPAMKIKKV